MASDWQIRANRRNAKKSTGPKTETGKRRSSINAMTHGGCSLAPDVRTGDPKFERARRDRFASFAPKTAARGELANFAFLSLRRVERLYAVEAARAELDSAKVHEAFLLERRARVDQAEARLLEHPYQSYISLVLTDEGCERLLHILERLRERLVFATWDADCLATLRAVEGLGRESTEAMLAAATEIVVELQRPAPAGASSRLLIDLTRNKPDEHGTYEMPECDEYAVPPLQFPPPGISEEELGRLTRSVNLLHSWIAETRERIESARVALEGDGDAELAARMVAARADFGPQGRDLGRCVSDATRTFQRAFDRLMVEESPADAEEPTAEAGATEPAPAAAAPAPKPAPAAKPPARNEAKANLVVRADRAENSAEPYYRPGTAESVEHRRNRPPAPTRRK